MNKPARSADGKFAKAKSPKTVTVEETVADIYWMVQELKRDLKGMRGEIGERLRVLELRLEHLQNPPLMPQWTPEMREALLRGLRKV